MPSKLQINIGDKFNHLTVVSNSEVYFLKSGKNAGHRVSCQCDCGNISKYICSDLKRETVKQCRNCANELNVTNPIRKGDIFGKLEIIDEQFITLSEGKTTIRRFYKCKCSCGDINFYRKSSLCNKKTKECIHCAYKKRPQSKIKLTDIEVLYKKTIIQRCSNTKTKEILPKLTLKEFENIIFQNCYYCGSKPRKIPYIKRSDVYANGIDRLDSNKDYESSNCVPCCKTCNIMKNILSKEEFFEMIKKIYNKWNLQDDTTQEK